MSESFTPALPGPGGGQGTATPGSTRVFAPTRVGSLRLPSISERGAIEEIHRRRMGETPRGVPRDDGTGGRMPAAREQRPGPRRAEAPLPGTEAPGGTPAGTEAAPGTGPGYSPLSSLLADAAEGRLAADWPASSEDSGE